MYERYHLRERFEELARRAGLSGLVDEYRRRGFNFRLLGIPGGPGTGLNGKEKVVFLYVQDLVHDRWTEDQIFRAILLHEMGHCEAHFRGLDRWEDETLAWRLAEEICPNPLPLEWEEIRAYSLSSYGLTWPATPRGAETPR